MRGIMKNARRYWSVLTAGSLLAMTACTGGMSCGSCGGAYDYPESTLGHGTARVEGAARMRVTQGGMDFIGEHLPTLLLNALGEDPDRPGFARLEINQSQTLVDTFLLEVIVGANPDMTESFPTSVLLDTRNLAGNITMELVKDADSGRAGDQAGVRMHLQHVPLGVEARVFADSGGTAACDVTGDNPPGSGIMTMLSLDIVVMPDITTSGCQAGVSECLNLAFDVQNVDLEPVNGDALDINPAPSCSQESPPLPAGCSLECSDSVFGGFDPNGNTECIATCGGADFASEIVGGLLGFIEGLIEPLMDDALELGLRVALADVQGQPASVSMRAPIASLAPALFGADVHDLGVLVAPTEDTFEVNCAPTEPGCEAMRRQGMDVHLATGFEAAPTPVEGRPAVQPPHPCVKPIDAAAFQNIYGQPTFATGDLAPLTGERDGTPYHFGVQVARDAINQAFFGLYNAGALCIEVDSDGVHALTGGGFPLAAGSIDLLTGGKLRQFASPDAPALVTITPARPPVALLGEGTADASLVALNWQQVEVGFHVMIHERWTRVFAVNADIDLGLSLINNAETSSLEVLINEGPSLSNLEQTYGELLPGVAFDEVLQTLVGIALDAALGGGLSFDYDVATVLSSALGVPLYVDLVGIEAPVEPGTGSRDTVGVFLALTDTPPMPRHMAPLPPQIADVDSVWQDVAAPLDGPGARATKRPSGAVDLTLPAGLTGDVFTKVDYGPWHAQGASDGALHVEDGKLRLSGRHTVFTRVDGPDGVTELPGVTVWVDARAPRVLLAQTAQGVQATATDVEDTSLTYAWRLDDGARTAFDTADSLDMVALAGAQRVWVWAKDRAGNVSKPAMVTLPRKDAASRTPAGGLTAEGCTQSSAAPAWLALAALAVLVRRKRT